MEHLSDKELLDLLEQFNAPSDGVAQHLRECDTCHQRWLALQTSWDALGDWTIPETEIDLTKQILQRAASVSVISWGQPKVWLRIAASVIIGVGLGALVGRMDSNPVSAEQASQAIYLDSLALHSSTGWTAPLLGELQE